MTLERRRHLTCLVVAMLTIVALATGCASGVERVVPTGEPGAVPYGWTDWCARNPDDPSCPRPAP